MRFWGLHAEDIRWEHKAEKWVFEGWEFRWNRFLSFFFLARKKTAVFLTMNKEGVSDKIKTVGFWTLETISKNFVEIGFVVKASGHAERQRDKRTNWLDGQLVPLYLHIWKYTKIHKKHLKLTCLYVLLSFGLKLSTFWVNHSVWTLGYSVSNTVEYLCINGWFKKPPNGRPNTAIGMWRGRFLNTVSALMIQQPRTSSGSKIFPAILLADSEFFPKIHFLSFIFLINIFLFKINWNQIYLIF